MSQIAVTQAEWLPVCQRSDLVAHSGVCVLLGDHSIALFFIPGSEPSIYAIDNWDPLANAGVIGRGLVAEVDGELTVASPLYKHHFVLTDGRCLEDATVTLRTYPVMLDGDTVCINFSA